MKAKQTTKVLVFTLAVIALLLRPSLTYQLAVSQHLSRDPVALNRLLQRLVKKKDDHHAVNAGELSAMQCAENKVPPPLRQAQAARQLNAAGPVFPVKQPAWFAMVYPSRAYYKLFSAFRI